MKGKMILMSGLTMAMTLGPFVAEALARSSWS